MKDIKGYENYEISPKGAVKSKITGQYLRLQKNTYGYYHVNLKDKTLMVHRLVAEHFIPNPNNLECVNHINGDKTDNHMDNLEWCTKADNNKHARVNGLHRGGGMKKPIIAIIDGRIIKKYSSAVDAERDGYKATSISSCVNGRKKTYKGMTWRFTRDDAQRYTAD